MGYFDDTNVEKLVSMLNDGIGKDSISVNQRLHNGDYVDFVSGPGTLRKNATINVTINKKNMENADKFIRSRSRRTSLKYVLAASVLPVSVNIMYSASESTNFYEFIMNMARPERSGIILGMAGFSYVFYQMLQKNRIFSGKSVGMNPYEFDKIYGRRELRNLAEYFRGSSRKSTL